MQQFFITFGKEATNHAKQIGDLTQAHVHVFVIGSLSVMSQSFYLHRDVAGKYNEAQEKGHIHEEC